MASTLLANLQTLSLSSSNYIVAADIFHVVGEVQNASPSVLTFVKIIATFYDSSNRVVATSNTYTSPPDLSPNDKAPFDLTVISASIPVGEIKNYRLTATSNGKKISTQSENNAPTSTGSNTGSSESATVSIPVSKAFVDGKVAYFIVTDASDAQLVSSVSITTNYNVNYAPVLAETNESSRQQGYVFINGMKSEDPTGSQLIVLSALPKNKGYNPLFEINYVKWNANANRVLKSVNEIMAAQKNGELTISKSDIAVNSPAINWNTP